MPGPILPARPDVPSLSDPAQFRATIGPYLQWALDLADAIEGLDAADWFAVLGTVSQFGGVPTGAIIERGSNANGEYTRYADGTQICTHKLAAASSGWQTWTFPAAFIDTGARPGGMAAPGLAPRSLSAGAVTTTTLDFACFITDTGVQSAAFCNLTVAGRWF